MQRERGVTQQGDMDFVYTLTIRKVRVVGFIVLREDEAVTDGCTHGHRMEEKLWETCHHRHQNISRAKSGAKEIAFVIPVTVVAAEPERENHSNVVEREIIRSANTRRVINNCRRQLPR